MIFSKWIRAAKSLKLFSKIESAYSQQLAFNQRLSAQTGIFIFCCSHNYLFWFFIVTFFCTDLKSGKLKRSTVHIRQPIISDCSWLFAFRQTLHHNSDHVLMMLMVLQDRVSFSCICNPSKSVFLLCPAPCFAAHQHQHQRTGLNCAESIDTLIPQN